MLLQLDAIAIVIRLTVHLHVEVIWLHLSLAQLLHVGLIMVVQYTVGEFIEWEYF